MVRVARVLDKAPPGETFAGDAASLAGDHVAAYLEYVWGFSRFDQLITHVLPLSQAIKAHQLMEGDQGMGKIVLDPTMG